MLLLLLLRDFYLLNTEFLWKFILFSIFLSSFYTNKWYYPKKLALSLEGSSHSEPFFLSILDYDLTYFSLFWVTFFVKCVVLFIKCFLKSWSLFTAYFLRKSFFSFKVFDYIFLSLYICPVCLLTYAANASAKPI